MNILVFSWRDPKHPLAGGAEQVMHEHAKGWVENGYQVTFFTSFFNGAARREVIDEVKIIRYGNQLLGVHLLAFFWYIFGKHEKFDLVIDQFHGLPFFTPLYVRTKKIAVLQEVAKEVWLMNHLPRPFNWIVGWIGYITEAYYFFLYKNVPFITGSFSAKKDLMRFNIPNQNITVIPHGVLLQLPLKKINKEKMKTVIFLGALAKDKGIEDAIKSVSLIRDNLSGKEQIQFWIVGKGSNEYKKKLEELILNLRIDGIIKFFGYVSQEKKFELLTRAHVLINPSAREGWGLVNIEANAVSTPVIAYSNTGLTDSVKDNLSGILCKDNTPEELAEIVLKVFNDPALYRKLQIGAKKWSQGFSWDNSKQKSIALINQVVGKNV